MSRRLSLLTKSTFAVSFVLSPMSCEWLPRRPQEKLSLARLRLTS